MVPAKRGFNKSKEPDEESLVGFKTWVLTAVEVCTSKPMIS